MHLKKNLFSSILLTVVFTNVSYVSEKVSVKNNENSFSVVNLKQKLNKKRSSFGYSLDDSISCYSLDISELSFLDKENVNDYLKKGGVILVNDQAVTVEDFGKIIDMDSIPVSFLRSNSNIYGSFLTQRNGINKIWSYMVDPISDTEYETEEQYKEAYASYQAKTTAENVLEWILDFIHKKINEWKKEDEKEEPEQKTNLGSTHLVTLVPFIRKPENGPICSYEIDASVRQGVKYIDTDTKLKRGIYDVLTKVTVDTEDDYAVSKYVPEINSNNEIIDASYIQSDVEKSYTLAGEIGANTKDIEGKISFEYTYVGSSTKQEVTNDFDFSNNARRWIVKPFEKEAYGATFQISPAIRLLSKEMIRKKWIQPYI